MSAPKDELVINLQVSRHPDGRYAATADLAGVPMCCYGADEGEAVGKTKAAAMRLVAGKLERGTVKLEAVRFKTSRA